MSRDFENQSNFLLFPKFPTSAGKLLSILINGLSRKVILSAAKTCCCFLFRIRAFWEEGKNMIFYHQFLSHLYVCDCNCVPFLSCICIPLQSGRPLTDSLRGKVINFLLSHHKLHKGHCPEEVLYQTIINAFGRIFDISVLYLACFSIFMSITEQNTGDKFCHEPLLAATKKFNFISNLVFWLVSLVLAFPSCSM